MAAQLDIVVSTLGSRMLEMAKRLPAAKEGLHWCVCGQQVDASDQETVRSILHERKDVQLVFSPNKGLSRGRNEALELTRSPYLLISDDDIIFKDDLIAKITAAYEKHPDAMAITFQAEHHGKEYPSESFKHNLKSLGKVASWEISLHRERFLNSGIRFDEAYGLGASYPTGEEFVLLTDLHKAGHPIYYEAELIVSHPDISSGYHYDDMAFLAKGAMIQRVFGSFSPIIVFWFAYRKRRDYSDHCGIFKALSLMRSGAKAVKNNSPL